MSLSATIKRRLYEVMHRRYLLLYALSGNNVECVCCGAKYITFLPAGIVKRANAWCPRCGSLERHRSIWLFLKNRTDFFTKKISVLHSAPEKIYYRRFSKLANVNYYPFDLNPENYGYGSKTLKMDITDIKMENDFFDVVLCNHVLEHIPDDRKAMSEMFRVLKPGGWALINVPVDFDRKETFEDPGINDPEKQLQLFGQPDHVRIYGADYVSRLSAAGFDVEVIDYNKSFNDDEIFRYGLKAGELIFLCKKHSS
jgi:SAM-dependent methyltransferase